MLAKMHSDLASYDHAKNEIHFLLVQVILVKYFKIQQEHFPAERIAPERNIVKVIGCKCES